MAVEKIIIKTQKIYNNLITYKLKIKKKMANFLEMLQIGFK